jgi:purine-nucleoside phosphorylase
MEDMNMHRYEEVKDAADALRARTGLAPEIAIVLGSGLSGAVGGLEGPVSISYEELPHWPLSRVEGHEGRLVAGRLCGRPVMALAGRCHLYEGHGFGAVIFGVRVMGLLGVRVLILTNAAGAVRADLQPGGLMAIDDHINLTGGNPLAGPNDERFGPRFPDMSDVYSRRLRTIAHQAAAAAGVGLAHGVYAAVTGPSYETPAEIRYLRTIGADAVGMSTVPEAIAARHMGLDVVGISCIGNLAAGVAARPPAHADVVETTRAAAAPLQALLEGIVGHL